MSTPPDDLFAPPSGRPVPPTPEPGPAAPYAAGPPAPHTGGPPGPPTWTPAGTQPGPPPGAGPGWYPQEAYYAPGWSGPVPEAPPARRRLGRRFWLPVAALAAIGLVVGVVFGVRFWLDRRPLGTVDAATTVAAARLTTGHCLQQLPADGDVSRVTVVPCSAPHAAEIIATQSLPAGPWPGQPDIDATLARWCEMDSAESAAGFHPVVWSPSARSWGQGDRTGLCIAALADGTATGSFVAGDEVTTG